MTDNRVLKNQPINFALYYEGDINLYTIYLDDGYPALALYLRIFNVSIYQIELAAPGTDDERKTKAGCHFYMTFPKDVLNLDGSEKILSDDDDWKAFYVAAPSRSGRTRGSSNDTIYFSRNSAGTIGANSSQDQNLSEILLTLSNIQAASGVQTRSSQVGLYYGGKTTYKAPQATEIENVSLANHGYDHTLFIINHYGKKKIPLHVGFTGSNTILNDGQTPNQLQLQITNIQNPRNPRPDLAIGQDSRFIIRFDEGNLTKEWALAEPDKVQGIAVAAVDNTHWEANRDNNGSDWIITPKKNSDGTLIQDTLDLGKSIDLNITNITSAHPSGQTKLTVRYEEIPDYWDGDLVCLIEKTPLMYRSPLKATADNQILTAVRIKTDFDKDDKSGVKYVGLAVETGNVGIGTTAPTEKLHVEGNIQTNSAFIGSADNACTRFSHKDCANQTDYGLLQHSNGRTILNAASSQDIAFKINDTEKMTLSSDGNVGINTTSPEEKLHIKDGSLRIDSGQIKSSGTIEFQPNTDQSAGEDLIKFLDKDANSVAIIKDDGKVGIGTTDPKGELHLVGNLILGNDTNDEKFVMHPRTNVYGDFLQITHDNSDGSWNWDRGIILNRDGNVQVKGTIKANSFDKLLFAFIKISDLTLNQSKDYGRLRATLKIHDGSGGHRVLIWVEVIDTSRSIEAIIFTPDMMVNSNSNISWENKSCTNKDGDRSCELLMYGQNSATEFYGCSVMISLVS